jgi:hypothetical protein
MPRKTEDDYSSSDDSSCSDSDSGSSSYSDSDDSCQGGVCRKPIGWSQKCNNRREYKLFGIFHSNLFARLDRKRDVIELLRDDKMNPSFYHGSDRYFTDPIVLGESAADIQQWLKEADFHKDFSVKKWCSK